MSTQENRHVVDVQGDSWALEHPVSCRQAGSLLDCPVHRWCINTFDDPPAPPGRYPVIEVGGGYELAKPRRTDEPVGEAARMSRQAMKEANTEDDIIRTNCAHCGAAIFLQKEIEKLLSISEKTDDMHTYMFSWSGPFSLSDEEEKVLTMAMSKLVLDRMPFFGAASLKHEVQAWEMEDGR